MRDAALALFRQEERVIAERAREAGTGSWRLWAFGVAALWIATLVVEPSPRVAAAQSPDSASVGTTATIDTTFEADDTDPPKRRLVKFNEYDGPISTLRAGFGFYMEYGAFSQDDESKEQVGTVEAESKLRDFRFMFNGKFKTKRPLGWTLGYMYDAVEDEWRFRQTGLRIGVPEIASSFFIGRTKEGYSSIKVMNGYSTWTGERSTALDAFVPILGDGIRWTGFAPKPRLFWSLGAYTDVLAENEKFCRDDNQVVTRLAWLPILSEESEKVLHLGVMNRIGKPDDGKIQVRSRPESNIAPYYVDGGKFDASRVVAYGAEAFYRTGSWLIGGEYHLEDVRAPEVGDPHFHGGDVAVVWLITGETRGYNAAEGDFEAVSPERTVFEGGGGAVEAVLRYSYIDLEDGPVRGGTFWRVSPIVNWHMSDNVCVEAAFGVGTLDRFDVKGTTQFFSTRLQLAL
jgi:phosphate-selective porin OprO/OprP